MSVSAVNSSNIANNTTNNTPAAVVNITTSFTVIDATDTTSATMVLLLLLLIDLFCKIGMVFYSDHCLGTYRYDIRFSVSNCAGGVKFSDLQDSCL